MNKKIASSSTSGIVVFIFLFILNTSSFAKAAQKAQAASVSSSTAAIPLSALHRSYWVGYFTDFKAIITSPLYFDRNQWLTTAGVMTAGGVLFALDGPIKNFIQAARTPATDQIANAVKPFGQASVVIPGILGGYLAASMLHHPHLQETTLLSLESVVLSGVMVQILKYALHRQRPYTGDSPYQFDGPSLNSNNADLSFPSGDVGVAFSLASVVAHEYPENIWVGVTAYGLSALVGWERIEQNAHWSSDVFFAGVLGYFTGAYLVRHHAVFANSQWSVLPFVGTHDAVGLQISYQF